MGTNREINDLILFDGVCKFCNHSINFILQHEQSDQLMFAPLQSEVGQWILRKYNLPKDYSESLLFLTQENLLTHAQAALKIASYLKAPWCWLSVFSVLPSSFTNFFYKLVARHRFKLMGQTDACIVPSPQIKARFLE